MKTFGLSPGCVAWLMTKPPYALLRTDLNFLTFLTKDVDNCQTPISTGFDVLIEFSRLHPHESPRPIVGFHVWGGAMCVMVGKNDNVFPKTLGEYVHELKRFFKERFGNENIFGTYASELEALVEEHASLPVLLAGNLPDA